MPNVSNIIASHNKHLLTIHAKPPDNLLTTRTCNCNIKESYPLNSRCLQESVVYQAVVERQDNKEQQSYNGQTEGRSNCDITTTITLSGKRNTETAHP